MLNAISIYCHFFQFIFMKKSIGIEIIRKRLFHTPPSHFVAGRFIEFHLMDQVYNFCVHISSTALKIVASYIYIYADRFTFEISSSVQWRALNIWIFYYQHFLSWKFIMQMSKVIRQAPEKKQHFFSFRTQREKRKKIRLCQTMKLLR